MELTNPFSYCFRGLAGSVSWRFSSEYMSLLEPTFLFAGNDSSFSCFPKKNQKKKDKEERFETITGVTPLLL